MPECMRNECEGVALEIVRYPITKPGESKPHSVTIIYRCKTCGCKFGKSTDLQDVLHQH